MSKDFRDDVQRQAVRQHHRRDTMAQIVEPHSRQAREVQVPFERLEQIRRIERGPAEHDEHEPRFPPAPAGRLTLKLLLIRMHPQVGDDRRWHVERAAGSFRFGFLERLSVAGTVERPCHTQPAGVQVQILPAETNQLALPHTKSQDRALSERARPVNHPQRHPGEGPLCGPKAEEINTAKDHMVNGRWLGALETAPDERELEAEGDGLPSP